MEVSDQNVGALDPSTLHNDTIRVKVDDLDPSGQNLDQSETKHPESQETSETESESLPIDTPNQSLPEDISYMVLESSRR